MAPFTPIGIALATILIAAAAYAREITIVKGVGGPDKLSSQGRLPHVFEIAAGDGTTNVASDAGEKHLQVTVVRDANDAEAVGGIVELDNVPQEGITARSGMKWRLSISKVDLSMVQASRMTEYGVPQLRQTGL